LDSEIANSFPELMDIKLSVTVVIHDLEDSLHTKDTSGTSGSKLVSEELDEIII
jgi:hypothetical protein